MSNRPVVGMTVVQGADSPRISDPDPDSHEVGDGEMRYLIRRLRQHDEARMTAYQRLRRETFVDGLGWQISVDPSGRERDRYDVALEGDEYVHSYGIYHLGHDRLREHLLGGIRIIVLRSWADSMLFNEFRAAGMLPDTVAEYLVGQPCTQFLELTRLCIRPNGLRGKFAAVRDYLYATVYRCAEHSTRSYAMAIAHPSMLAVLRRSHFAFHILHAHAGQNGYALVSVDLAATIDALRARQAHEQVARLLCLCHCSGEGLDGPAQPAIV